MYFHYTKYEQQYLNTLPDCLTIVCMQKSTQTYLNPLKFNEFIAFSHSCHLTADFSITLFGKILYLYYIFFLRANIWSVSHSVIEYIPCKKKNLIAVSAIASHFLSCQALYDGWHQTIKWTNLRNIDIRIPHHCHWSKNGNGFPCHRILPSSSSHMEDIGLSDSHILLMIFRTRLLQIREEVKDFSKFNGNSTVIIS